MSSSHTSSFVCSWVVTVLPQNFPRQVMCYTLTWERGRLNTWSGSRLSRRTFSGFPYWIRCSRMFSWMGQPEEKKRYWLHKYLSNKTGHTRLKLRLLQEIVWKWWRRALVKGKNFSGFLEVFHFSWYAVGNWDPIVTRDHSDETSFAIAHLNMHDRTERILIKVVPGIQSLNSFHLERQ